MDHKASRRSARNPFKVSTLIPQPPDCSAITIALITRRQAAPLRVAQPETLWRHPAASRLAGQVWSAQNLLLLLCALVGECVWQEMFTTLAAADRPPAEVLIDSTHIKADRCATGRKAASNRKHSASSRGGRAAKIRALSDELERPLAFLLIGGQATKCRAAEVCCTASPPPPWSRPADPTTQTPPASKSKVKVLFLTFQPVAPGFGRDTSTRPLRGYKAIEQMFNRLTDFRRIPTRCDKLAVNSLSAATSADSP